jgi:hypothetical protein
MPGRGSVAGCQTSGSNSARGCGQKHHRPVARGSCGAAATQPGSFCGAQRTARAWSLDGHPLLGISVFAVLDMTLDELLSRRFATFAIISLPTAGDLRSHGFDLLPTGLRPHFTIRLHSADQPELTRLLDALGPPQRNPQYARSTSIWRQEG